MDLPPIGCPIDDTRIFLLDENGVAAEAGEICIAGAGLARGYRGRPDLTAEKFGWLALDDAPPIRIYRTGDRGRRLRDGQIAFLGRIDDQVNIRGFRIEPGEIEAAVNAHAGVLESAVVVRKSVDGENELALFLVARPGESPSREDIQSFLAVRLPAYMIPSHVVGLPALPLTSHGKVDRGALRVRPAGSSLGGESYVAPCGVVETRLAHIVEGLLNKQPVSVHDDFFRLGGHSLLGTQLLARIRDAFGVRVTLRYLFESPTIAALATEIERLRPQRIGISESEIVAHTSAPVPHPAV